MSTQLTDITGSGLDGWRPPKQRLIVGYYLAVWLSAGLFIFVWLTLLMRDINKLHRRRVLNVGVLMGTILGLLVFGQALIFYRSTSLAEQGIPLWFHYVLLTTGLGAFLELFAVIAVVYRFAVSASRGRIPAGSLMGIIFLSFLWFASLPLIQSEVNHAIRRSS